MDKQHLTDAEVGFGAPGASGGRTNAEPKYFTDEEAGFAPPSRTLGTTARDIGVTALKGAVGLPQAAVGLLDIPTGGHAGKVIEGAGVRFKDAQDTLDTMYSPAQQEANRKVREADGFLGTAKAMLENPSTIATGIGESLPQMLGGAGVARGAMALAPKLGPVLAGALGEGVVGAGSAAEQVRGQTQDGLLTGKQAALAGASGLATAGLGALGGKVAQRVGVGDVDTMLAQGAARSAGQGSTRSMPRQIAEGAVAEGVLEEMPQSMAEQALQNVALDKPVGEGVGAAAAQGLITGTAMGGAGGAIGASGNRAQQRAQEQAAQSTEDPAQAPAGAAPVDAAPPAMEPATAQTDTPPGAQDQSEPVAQDAATPTSDPVTPEQRIAQLEERLSFIQQQAKGNGWDQRLIGARDAAQAELDALRPASEASAATPAVDPRPLSEQMGIDRTAGPLSKIAATAVDTGATPVQFLGATGRALQTRQTGPGVTNESNVIDVQGRVVDERAIPTPRRLIDAAQSGASQQPAGRQALPAPANLREALDRIRQQRAEGERLASQSPAPGAAVPALGGPTGDDRAGSPSLAIPDGSGANKSNAGRSAAVGAGGAKPGAAQPSGRGNGNAPLRAPTSLREGLERIRAQRQEAANAKDAAQQAAAPAQAIPTARAPALEAARPAPVSPTTGVTNGPEASQAQQSVPEPAQAGGPARPAATAAPRTAPAGGSGLQTGGLTNAAPAQNDGAQGTPAAGAQGQAPQTAVARPDGWRKSMLKAGPVAKAMGIETRGKRLAQVVAEIDAADAQRATGLSAQQQAQAATESVAQDAEQSPAQETTHNGTRIYPTKIKMGDEVKSMWAVESPDNQRRRAAGERTIGGDSLHDTIEQAKAAAEREAKRDAERQAAKAEQDAADKARLDAEEARKAANRPKTVVERRKDAILDGPSKIGQGSKRAVITTAVDSGYVIEAKMVYDHAAKKRDQEAVDRASRAGYILGVSNENLPLVKAGNEAKARLKEGKYEKPEYRVYQGSDTKAPFREITKTEYDYAQELKAQRAASQQAEAAQPITRADVTAAQQQAATLITERIDAMTAGEVNTIARRFLPTMGVKPTVSKERNKAAVTDFTKVNPMAAAAEFGVTLPADVRRALDAEMQGKVADAGQDDGLAARADGDDDYLRTLFGGSDTAEQDAVSPAQTQKIDAQAAVPMLRKLAQEKRAEAEDWSSRKYKGNKSQVNLRGDGPSNQETMSVSAVNESRRRKAVESLVAQANAADKLADRIESGSINIQSALDNISSAVDSDIKRDGGKPSIGKSRQDMFEGYISSQLLADPYAGYGEGTVSSALRAMYEGQQARADNRKKVETKEDDTGNVVKFSRNGARGITPEQRAENFARWSDNAPLISSEQAEAYDFKTGQKIVVEAFHGSARPDRIGGVFDPKRATSGPMAYFTSSPELASSYAKGKADTSLADEDQSYANWFKFKPPGARSAVSIDRAWHFLTPEVQARIRKLAPQIAMDDTGENIVIDPDNTDGLGNYGWELQQARGNPLAALVESWLTSGTLFNEETQFMDVLRMAGFPVAGVEMDFPNAAYPGVFKTYVSMKNPLVVGDMPADVRAALEQAAKADRTKAKPGADMWDKRSHTLRDWWAKLNDPDPQTAAYAWTSIPDKVTDVLKAHGYDGIVDWSGKGGGHQSPVYIPFGPTQVKSVFNRGTFDPTKKDISFGRGANAAIGTPAATIRAAITKAYGNLLGQLESKGLVTLTQTEDEAIEAAAQARADKTGQSLAEVRASLMGSVSNSVATDDLDIRRSANGAIQGFFDPQTGQSFLIADNLSAEAAPGVLMHEVGIHMAADGSMKALFNRAAMMLKLQRGNPFIKAVQARMDAAGETSGEEAAAYIAEAYENDRANAPASVQRWLADLLAAVKAWMFKKGIMGADRLTVADIAAVARANAKTLARGYVTRSQETGTQSLERAMRDAGFSHAPAGDQTQTENFRRWFAGSKAVDADGKPLVVYHGTTAEISAFQQNKAAEKDAGWYGRGIYFTADPDTASTYSRYEELQGKELSGAPRVMPVYVSIQNPYVWPTNRRAATTPEEAAAIRKELEAQGHDGVIVPNEYADPRYAGHYEVVAFRPEQVKSAIGNNGNFDPSNPDIRFSRATEAAKAAGDAIKSVTVTNIKKKAGFKLTDYLGIGLQALGRRQIVDLYGDMLPLAEYNRLVTQMEADKNEGGAEADQLVTRWAKLPDEAKLADLMHDATLAQIDPDKPYVDGDDKAAHMMLQGRFKALSDDAKAVYRATRDAYRAHHAKVRSAIKDRIERSEIKGERKAALLKQMDSEFFKAVKGVYFPLARFGQYVVVVKDADGKVASVNRAETMAEAQALRTSLLKAFPAGSGHTVARPILGKEFIAGRDAVGRGFMTELYAVLDKQDMDAAARAELEDTLGQLYLSSLPDLSWAKHGIHRKGTPGFSQDARRAYAQNMFHGARYLAKLRYSDLMQDELNAMQQHVDDWKEVEDFDQPKAQRVVDEMNKRHESLMNPKSNPLSTALTSFGFIFHLGLSPASAMVNLSQTALVAYPIMGAKWGFGKASAALLKASGEAARGKNDITGALTAQERQAYDEAVRTGVIDVTMAHDLAGISQGEDAGVMWKLRPVMKWASFMFHHAERFNRQVTFVAAYRLAREAGASHESAYEQAADATYKGHFDYSACVDDATEILTASGWKKRTDLKVGDVAIATDPSGRAVQSKVLAINVYKGDREVIEFKSANRFSMVLTPNHDAVIQSYNSRDKKWQGVRKVRADSLKNHHFILRAPLAPLESNDGELGEDFAALLGWIAAEGWYSKYRKTTAATDVRIGQSVTHNPEYVAEIRGILERLGGEFKEYTYERSRDVLTTFVLRRALGRRIQECLPEKVLTPELVARLSTTEKRAFIMAFLKGDGCQNKDGKRAWLVGQKAGANLDLLQAMATMCGMRATVTGEHKNGMAYLYVVTDDDGYRSHVRPLEQIRRTESLVWCPTTEHGTWIARRNGAVFVTGNSNRPRIMQGNTARVLLLFKQYGQNMIYTLARSAHQSLKGATPEARAEARKTLGGLLTMHAAAAGVLGLPMVSTLLAAASMLGGDDDEPWDAQVALQNMLADAFGQKPAEVLAHGFSRLTPWDVSGRVGLDRLIFPDVQEGLEGQRLGESAMAAALGPVAGIGINALKGLQLMSEGHYLRGLEALAPSVVRGPLKALRYESEGVKDKTGIVVQDEVDAAALWGQVAGFSPSDVRRSYEGKSAIVQHDRALQARRSALVEQFAMAAMAGDETGKTEAREDIAKFNEKNPARRILPLNLMQSVAQRQKRIREAREGVYLPAKRRDAMEQGRFAAPL